MTRRCFFKHRRSLPLLQGVNPTANNPIVNSYNPSSGIHTWKQWKTVSRTLNREIWTHHLLMPDMFKPNCKRTRIINPRYHESHSRTVTNPLLSYCLCYSLDYCLTNPLLPIQNSILESCIILHLFYSFCLMKTPLRIMILPNFSERIGFPT